MQVNEGVKVKMYTFPNGARLYTDRARSHRGARYGPAWTPNCQSIAISRGEAARALQDARRQKLKLNPLTWQAG